ncbi:hypothetical protein Adt_20433 [Abeliophyllum distichum]|uniref:Uncharacterized protein n=1 Tax=Abeliophyllum distichum TaxID=126358 RepID=A0ABD1SWL5_9LAMI
MCLGFLLDNHPVLLLHPYTKEWKVKLEEMELGCDAPDEDDDNSGDAGENQIVDWIEEANEEKLLDAMCPGVGWGRVGWGGCMGGEILFLFLLEKNTYLYKIK